MRRAIVTLTCAVVASSVISATPTVRFTITDLGLAGFSPDGDAPTLAINRKGIVAGQTTTTMTGWDSYYAFVYDRGQLLSFGSSSTGDNAANDINDQGIVAAGRSVYQHTPSGMVFLGTLPDNGIGTAINNKNEIAGFRDTAPGMTQAILYTTAGQHDLGSLGGTFTLPYDMNNKSQVVGVSTLQNEIPAAAHAFLASPNTPIVDLGTLGGRDSRAFGINDRGEIVGFSNLPGEHGFCCGHAFLYTQSQGMMDLGTLGGPLSMADAINNRGHIVGLAQLANFDVHAFVYAAGTMFDLNDWIDPASSWVLSRAVDINDSGQIIAFGAERDEETGDSGDLHILLLTPIE